jgi:hypothetical protein
VVGVAAVAAAAGVVVTIRVEVAAEATIPAGVEAITQVVVEADIGQAEVGALLPVLAAGIALLQAA